MRDKQDGTVGGDDERGRRASVDASEPPATPFVVALTGSPMPASSGGQQPTLAIPSLVGAKAANLSRLADAGIAVPEGLVLTTSAHLAAQSRDSAEPVADDGLSRPLTIPADVDAAISAIAAHFEGEVLAVRSSALNEDRPTASYAGLYETSLGVRGITQLRDAVLACWNSASTKRVRSYAPDAADSAPIAVLVQRQLEPDIAGVAFTADPVTGDRSVILVSAVPGLGDGLVNGTITPDQWQVSDGTATPRHANLQAMTAEQALSVATLARRIEKIMGAPQDIEWAMDSERLILLQARPITALPQEPRDVAVDGIWVKELDRYAEPMTALGASVATVVVARGLTALFETYGGLIDRVECRSVGGEIYLRMIPLGGREAGSPPPAWLFGLLVRTVPALRRRMRAARRTASPAALADAASQWRNAQRGELRERIVELQRIDLAHLNDAELAAHLTTVRKLGESAMATHFRLSVPSVAPLYEFVQLCERLLDIRESHALGMLSGISTASSEPARKLAPIVHELHQYPDAVAAIRSGRDISSTLNAVSSDLGLAFKQWKIGYASVCMSDDPGSETLAEQTEVLRELLLTDASATAARLDSVVQSRLEAIREARLKVELKGKRAVQAFETALARAEEAYGLREDVAFWTGSQCGGLMRTAAMEAGRRLAAQGRIDRAGDAVHLDIDSLIAAVTSEAAMHEMVSTALAERAWVRQHPGPAVLGGAAPELPDLRHIPRRARTLNAALLWVRSAPSSAASTPPAAVARSEVVSGVPGSGGRYEGPARIIRSEADFGALREGDVLVTTTTDPAWSVLFAIAGALVTESGGVLSHAAIVAREHGLPAVLAVSGATSVFRDGDILTVDGTRGLVSRLDQQATRKQEREEL